MSDIKPPIRESKNVEPMRFVRVLAELGISKSITELKYRTKLTVLATKPMLSSAMKPIGRGESETT